MSNFSTTTNAVWIPEVIANEAIGRLSSYLNLGATVAKDNDLTPVRVGQTISIPRRGAVTVQTKEQGSPSSAQAPTADEVTVTVDQHKYIKLLEEDFTAAMQTGSVLPGYAEDGVIALAEAIETHLTNNFSSFPNIDVVISSATDAAYKAVGNVRARMVKNKVPKLAQLYAYASPDFVNGLLNSTTAFLDPKLIPNNRPLTEGTIGRCRGYDFFEGQLVPRAGSPGWDQNFFYARDALVLASRPLLQPAASLGVESATVQSEAGLALRLVRYYDGDEMGVVVQLDTAFGSAVNDVRQGFVLESQ